MTSTVVDPRTAWQAWHTEREQALAVPQGWLSLVGYHWVPAEGGLPGLPGSFTVTGDGPASFTAVAGDGVTDRSTGTQVDGTVQADVPESGSLIWLEHDGVAWELIRRKGRLAFRVRDPRADALREFTGVPTFDFAADWAVTGTFVAFDQPRQVTVDTALPGLQQHYQAIGAISLQLPGVVGPTELLAYAAGGAANGSTGLNVLFHDATNGVDTALWRSVGVPAPTETGSVTVDFNRATNMPFAFSDFGTCPQPPAGNLVPAAVTAGERTPAGRSATAGADDPTV